MAEWFRVLGLKSGGPRFKSYTLPFNFDFVLVTFGPCGLSLNFILA